MKYSCQVCKTWSKSVDGHDVWARECGFCELHRPINPVAHGVYVVCSQRCASELLLELGILDKEIVPHGRDSAQWRCEECNGVLPANLGNVRNAKSELVPTVLQFVHPYQPSGEYHCFCSDKCLLEYLEKPRKIDCKWMRKI